VLTDLIRRPYYLAEYAGVRAFLFAAQAVPLEEALALGEWAGRQTMAWTPGRVGIVMDNLRHAFPEKGEAELRAICRGAFEHFGRATVEVAVAHRLVRPTSWRDHITVRNEHYLNEALAEGKGAIFLTGHLGVYEIFGLLLSFRGLEMASVYRPMKNPLVDRLLRQRRMVFKQTVVERQGALPALWRILRNRGYVGLVIDQHIRRDGLWVPFFGRPAATTPAPALLALRTGAPIVTGFARRVPGLFKFELFVDEPIRARPTRDRDGDVMELTARISRRIEGYIRRCPEQWLWMHRRWRPVPPEDIAKGNLYVGPSGQTH
jgi:KDO2-lipid IV(A) lauroyltransferase